MLGISRGSIYYQSRPVSAATLNLMHRIDKRHMELPGTICREHNRGVAHVFRLTTLPARGSSFATPLRCRTAYAKYAKHIGPSCRR